MSSTAPAIWSIQEEKKRLHADWNHSNCPFLCLQAHYREAKVQQSPNLSCLLCCFCSCCYSINNLIDTQYLSMTQQLWVVAWVQIMQQRESLINHLTNISQATAQPSCSLISTSVWWLRPNCPALKHLHLLKKKDFQDSVRCVICQQSQIKVDVFTDDRQVG